jgi:putative PIN family toxin of toxin-antitoxin system
MVDANVLITGIIWPRWQNAILAHALRGDLQLVLSRLIIEEASEHIRSIDPSQYERFEQFLLDCALELVDDPSREEVERNHDLMRDKTDIPIALAAIDAKVDYLVTYDRDFTDDNESTKRVREAIPGIILPPIFLRDVMGWTSEQLEAIRHREWPDLANS